MSKLIVPLYFRPADFDLGIPSSFVLRLMEEEDGVLVTRENFDEMIETDGDGRALEVTVFNLASEARVADRMIGEPEDSEIWHLKTGEGVLLTFSERKLIEEDGVLLRDFRTGGRRNPELFGSWELPEAECDALMRAPVAEEQTLRGEIIASTLSDLPPQVLQCLQVSLERIPGSFVGFVAASPDEVRKDYRLDGIGKDRLSDAEIQSALCKASSKSDPSDTFAEALDATVARILEARPDLADIGDGLEP